MADSQNEKKELTVSMIKFTEYEDGTMAVEAKHAGDFDPTRQSHNALRTVTNFLPNILRPAGIEPDGDFWKQVPISDQDRYHAMRLLALMPPDLSIALADRLEKATDEEPQNEAEFDSMVDKLVLIARGVSIDEATKE